MTALEVAEAEELDGGGAALSALPHPAHAAITATTQPATPIRSISTRVPPTCHRYPAFTADPGAAGETLV
ncbi:MAG TPA: hypothetical protein VFQ42_18810 [Mycobacterium sp.]|nr:hypothetical protein [Mycobacterium sp.]